MSNNELKPEIDKVHLERRVYRAVRNFLVNENGLSMVKIQEMMLQLVRDRIVLNNTLIEGMIKKQIMIEVTRYRGASSGDFNKMIAAAVVTEVQAVVGQLVREALKDLKIDVGTTDHTT